ncbi:hypothetical protein [Clavibacter sp. VKM Ac-2872]|uniref:hypothetical protein n=1 Tax=Clavibacter sp. VKM Ac-2872 TaxID=2783812 RepID=UPI00188C29F9|nr:hypothetical protein [Clavibacter sp. VKM Ac-2872]MBF4625688.1 hypothetical protein [Clavibacter sp. VKM Ac-2872]
MLIALRAVSRMLAVSMLGAGTLELVRSRQDTVEGGMQWAEGFSATAVKAIAALEVVEAIGLAALMIVVVVHARRRESVVPPLTLLVLALAAAALGVVFGGRVGTRGRTGRGDGGVRSAGPRRPRGDPGCGRRGEHEAEEHG